MSLYDAYVKQGQAIRAAEVVVDSMEPIDWRMVIDHMVRAGISISKIGTTVGVSHETVRGWRSGSIPNYEAGRRLLAMSVAVAGIPVGDNLDRTV